MTTGNTRRIQIMNRLKRGLAIALAAVTVLGAAGCGSKKISFGESPLAIKTLVEIKVNPHTPTVKIAIR